MGLIQQKQTKMPKAVVHKVRLSVADIQRIFELRHLRENDGLVCAEGRTYHYYLADSAKRMLPVGNTIFCYFNSTQKLVQINGSGYAYTGLPLPHTVVFLSEQNGVKQWLALTDEAGYLLKGNQSFEKIVDVKSTCATVFKERIFTLSDNVIRYTAPLDMKNWSELRYGGGQVEIPAREGKFIGIVAFRDELYLFRERGITRLDASGDDLNFKALPLRYGAGEIVPGTIADCGDCIVFFTDLGLCTFDGSTCKLHEGVFFEQISGKPTNAVSNDGRYYAICTHKRYGLGIYCFNPQTGKANFAFLEADCLTSCNGLWLARGKYLFSVSGCGMSTTGNIRLINPLSDFGLGCGAKTLEAVTVVGSGTYDITGNSEQYISYTVSGAAEEKLCFPRPLYGKEFTLDITALEFSDVKIKELILYFREV